MPRVPRPSNPSFGKFLLIAGLGAAGACSGPGRAPLPAPRSPDPAAPEVPLPAPARAAVGPEALALPEGGDEVIARLAGVEVRKHQVYDFLLRRDPAAGLQVLHSLVGELLAARIAAQSGISVPAAELAWFLDRRLEQDEREARSRFGADAGLEEYAANRYGMTLSEYRAWAEDTVRRQVLYNYVVAYEGLREERVRCRMMALPSREEAVELRGRVRAGADFAALAAKHSLDPTAARGGRVPAFARDHPVLGRAFDLEPGQVSEPVPGRLGDRDAWFLIYLEEREPGRDLPYAELASEVARKVRERPPGQEEFIHFLGAAARRFGLRLPGPDTTRGAHDRGVGPGGGGEPGGRG